MSDEPGGEPPARVPPREFAVAAVRHAAAELGYADGEGWLYAFAYGIELGHDLETASELATAVTSSHVPSIPRETPHA